METPPSLEQRVRTSLGRSLRTHIFPLVLGLMSTVSLGDSRNTLEKNNYYATPEQVTKDTTMNYATLEGCFIWPVSEGIPGSQYGMRKHPRSGLWKHHDGIDIREKPENRWSAKKTPILATYAGVVQKRGYQLHGAGHYLTLDHTPFATDSNAQVATTYMHMRYPGSPYTVGDTVTQGDTLGYVGSSGAVTGPHLHYEVRKQGKPVNPIPYFKKTIQDTYKQKTPNATVIAYQ